MISVLHPDLPVRRAVKMYSVVPLCDAPTRGASVLESNVSLELQTYLILYRKHGYT